MYGVELGIIILATLCCCLISSSPAMGSTGLLIFWRIIMVSLQGWPLLPALTKVRALVSVAIIHYPVLLRQSKLLCSDLNFGCLGPSRDVNEVETS